ncbi:metal-dependent membrane protease, partial [human gut metagenome]
MTLVHGKKVFSLLSGKGICFFLICGVASLSIGLLEEYVWRGILLNMFLAAWGKKKNGIYCAVVVSSLGFGLCHYRNLLVGQNFADTTKQVLYAICFGMFLAAFFYTDESFIYSGPCTWTFVIFLIFLCNEILGWNYTVWKYDDILQGVLAVFYLIAGLYVVY